MSADTHTTPPAADWAPAPKDILRDLAHGARYDAGQFQTALDVLSGDDATVPQRAAFLALLRGRGESVAEIAGAAGLMRARMRRVQAPHDAIDIVGTGGDGHGT